MKKTYKAALALVLTVALLIGAAVPAFAATADNVKQYKSMTVIGDSIPCAYGYPTCSSLAPAEGSFPDDLAGMLAMDTYYSLAFCGCDLTHVLYMLGIEDERENLAEMRAYSMGRLSTDLASFGPKLDAIRAEMNAQDGEAFERLSSSDLILIDIGSNNLLRIPIVMAERDYNALLSEGVSTGEALVRVGSKIPAYLAMGTEYFRTAYPKLIQKLQSINPDATIVLVGYYNPFYNCSLLEGVENINCGKLINTTVMAENAQLKIWAKQYGCVYADMFELSKSFKAQSLMSGTDLTEWDTHPTMEGNQWMAEQILAALPTAEKKLCMPANTSVRMELCGNNVGEYTLKYSNLGWTLKDNASGEYLSVSADKSLVSGSNAMVWGYDGGFYCIKQVTKTTSHGFKYLSTEKLYLTVEENGTLGLSSARVNAALYVRN